MRTQRLLLVAAHRQGKCILSDTADPQAKLYTAFEITNRGGACFANLHILNINGHLTLQKFGGIDAGQGIAVYRPVLGLRCHQLLQQPEKFITSGQFNEARIGKKQSNEKKIWQIRVKTLKKWLKNRFFVFKILKYIRFGKRYFERVQYGASRPLSCR
jgi:hypothetical protein